MARLTLKNLENQQHQGGLVLPNSFGDRKNPGRDEMNLAEFPIALLSDRAPRDVKTLSFEGRDGRLVITGTDAYGLPTAADSDVIVGLIQLTKRANNFTDPTVTFTRYELLKLLGWPDRGHYYERLEDALYRWVGVTLAYHGSWWDSEKKRKVDAAFHILESVVIDKAGPSAFTWNGLFFQSCQAGNLKRLDLDTYFGLGSAVSKQLYRFLDKRFHVRSGWTFDLRELAFEHVGLSRNYTAAKLKEKLQPALEELEGIGFLQPMGRAERYAKVGRGDWQIQLVRAKPKAKAVEEPGQPAGLELELVQRGVTRAKAAELVGAYPEDRIRAKVEQVDWLREKRPKKVADTGAYLVGAIRDDYAAPAGFEPKAQREQREQAERERQRRENEERQRLAAERAQEAAERTRIAEYWAGLSTAEQTRLQAEALDQADAETVASYRAVARTPVGRMLLSTIRDAHIARLLGCQGA